MAKWRGWESNPRHHDFQSCALPTELPRLGNARAGPRADGKASDRRGEGLIALGGGADSCSPGDGPRRGGRCRPRIRGLLGRPAHATGAARAAAPVRDRCGARRRRPERRDRRLRGRRRPAGRRAGGTRADRRPAMPASSPERSRPTPGSCRWSRSAAGRRCRSGGPTRSASATWREPTCSSQRRGSAPRRVRIECAATGDSLGCASRPGGAGVRTRWALADDLPGRAGPPRRRGRGADPAARGCRRSPLARAGAVARPRRPGLGAAPLRTLAPRPPRAHRPAARRGRRRRARRLGVRLASGRRRRRDRPRRRRLPRRGAARGAFPARPPPRRRPLASTAPAARRRPRGPGRRRRLGRGRGPGGRASLRRIAPARLAKPRRLPGEIPRRLPRQRIGLRSKPGRTASIFPSTRRRI